MQPQPSPAKSIFVSHTNDDELADVVLNKLVEAFRKEPPACGLRLVYDGGDIQAGEAWRQRIFEWLDNCPAAILLVSPGSFLREKPWVAREAFFLAVRRAVHQNVLVIPVTIGGARKQITEGPEFEPAQTRELEWIECPDPRDAHALAQVVEKVRLALTCLPAPLALSGLSHALSVILTLHPGAQALLADALGVAPPARPDAIALELVSASVERVTEAVRAFARYAGASEDAGRAAAFESLCQLLVAREVPETAAHLLGLEMRKAPDDALPVLIDSVRTDVSEFYVVRSAGRHDHGWTLLNVTNALEAGRDIVFEMKKALADEFGELDGKDEDQDDDEETLESVDRETARRLRQVGQPVVFCVNVSTLDQARSMIDVWRATYSVCGLMLRRKNGQSAVEPWNENWLLQLQPPLDAHQVDTLLSLKRVFDRFHPKRERS